MRKALGAARLVSTPSPILKSLARDCHESRMTREVSPNLSSSFPYVSTRAGNTFITKGALYH